MIRNADGPGEVGKIIEGLLWSQLLAADARVGEGRLADQRFCSIADTVGIKLRGPRSGESAIGFLREKLIN